MEKTKNVIAHNTLAKASFIPLEKKTVSPTLPISIFQTDFSNNFTKFFVLFFRTMAAFPDIKSKHSLVAKHVTKEKWDKLSGITTKTSGFTLAKAIACAVEFDNQHCGIYAGDEDSYADFADVFDPLICEYHGLPAGFAHQSDMDSSKITGNVEPDVPVHSARYSDDKFTKTKSKAAFFFFWFELSNLHH